VSGGSNPFAQFLDLYFYVVLVAVVTSWMQLPPNNPIVRYSGMLTEPVLAPIRKLLPPMGGLDFSPLILLVLLRFLRGMV